MLGPGVGAIEMGEPSSKIVILFSFNQIFKGGEQVKIYRKCFHSGIFESSCQHQQWGTHLESALQTFQFTEGSISLIRWRWLVFIEHPLRKSCSRCWVFILKCYLLTSLYWDLEVMGIILLFNKQGNWVTATSWTDFIGVWILSHGIGVGFRGGPHGRFMGWPLDLGF